MRIVLMLILLAVGWLFMMENDQEHVTITVPGSSQIGPFSVGVIVLGSVLVGILLCLLGGMILKVASKMKKKKLPNGGNPTHAGPPDPLH